VIFWGGNWQRVRLGQLSGPLTPRHRLWLGMGVTPSADTPAVLYDFGPQLGPAPVLAPNNIFLCLLWLQKSSYRLSGLPQCTTYGSRVHKAIEGGMHSDRHHGTPMSVTKKRGLSNLYTCTTTSVCSRYSFSSLPQHLGIFLHALIRS
jgi:hypothetical protein